MHKVKFNNENSNIIEVNDKFLVCCPPQKGIAIINLDKDYSPYLFPKYLMLLITTKYFRIGIYNKKIIYVNRK